MDAMSYIQTEGIYLKADKRKKIIERLVGFIVCKDPIEGDVSEIRAFLIEESNINTLHCIKGVKTCLEGKRYQAIINRLIGFIIFKTPIKGEIPKINAFLLDELEKQRLIVRDNLELTNTYRDKLIREKLDHVERQMK